MMRLAFIFLLVKALLARAFLIERPNHRRLNFRRCFYEQKQDESVPCSQIQSVNKSVVCSRRSVVCGILGTIIVSKTDPVEATTMNSRTNTVEWKPIFDKAAKRALGGGRAGASAAVVQVFSLMWLRTAMNYQYRYGGNLGTSLSTLWEEGGIGRLYQGLPFALIQGPLTRFGDTAANVGVLALLEALPETTSLPLPVKTAIGSISAGVWRIFLMPIDSAKTTMQVKGATGLEELRKSVKDVGPGPLYRGSFAQAAATAAGHFPWFFTFNLLNENIPAVSSSEELLLSLSRAAVIGMLASCVSDCVSNGLRVIKTTKQTAQKEMSYPDVVAMIVKEDGVTGLLGRGLQTRLLTNAIQGALFSVLWKYFQQLGTS